MKAIEVKNLTFSYGKKAVLNNISLEIESNKVFGLLGPNGAGKTTLLECIQGLKTSYKGEILVNQLDSIKNKKDISSIIGVQFQSSEYFDYIKVFELFEFFACLYDIDINNKKIDKLLNDVSLLDKKNSYVNQLSGGQKQKVSIALSIINNPKILFLDEPTTGLDPLSRAELWSIIKNIKLKGTTIVLTTHYMEEVEALCDEVCFISKGSIYDFGTPEKLIKKSNIESTVIIEINGKINIDELNSCPYIGDIIKEGDLYKIYTNDCNKCINRIYSLEKENNFKVLSLKTHKANLEDVFLKITGGKLRDEEIYQAN